MQTTIRKCIENSREMETEKEATPMSACKDVITALFVHPFLLSLNVPSSFRFFQLVTKRSRHWRWKDVTMSNIDSHWIIYVEHTT